METSLVERYEPVRETNKVYMLHENDYEVFSGGLSVEFLLIEI